MEYTVEHVQLEEQPAAVVRGLVPVEGIPGFLAGVFGEVLAAVDTQGVRPAGIPFARYVPTAGGFQVEAGFPTSAPVQPLGRVVPAALPGGPAIQVLHQGPYDDVAAAYSAAEAWLVDHGLSATGPPWEAYLDGPEVAEPRTLVTLPCRRG